MRMSTNAGLVGLIGLTLALATGCGDDETTSSGTTGAGTGTGTSTNTGTGTGSGTGGTGGGGGTLLNGCSVDMATDHTGEATVSVTDIEPWSIPHQVCITVDAGTTVEWEGTFASHPLSGGSPGSPDASSPITTAEEDAGTISVALATAGEYPYFCTIHGMTMQGVIYAQ